MWASEQSCEISIPQTPWRPALGARSRACLLVGDARGKNDTLPLYVVAVAAASALAVVVCLSVSLAEVGLFECKCIEKFLSGLSARGMSCYANISSSSLNLFLVQHFHSTSSKLAILAKWGRATRATPCRSGQALLEPAAYTIFRPSTPVRGERRQTPSCAKLIKYTSRGPEILPAFGLAALEEFLTLLWLQSFKASKHVSGACLPVTTTSN